MSVAVVWHVTTWTGRRLHYAGFNDLIERRKDGRNDVGRVGLTLCGEDGFDQAAMDSFARRYGGKGVTIDKLPTCQKCEKAFKKQIGGAKS